MNVLIIGSGGREHALAWKLAREPRVRQVLVAPGSAGIAQEAECAAVRADDVAGLASLALGCSEPTTGRVFGTVSVDGQPPKTGSISFFPTSGKGRTTGGEIIDGKYSVEASLGEMRIEVRIPKVVGEKKLYDAPNSPVKQLMAETLPPKYNDESELRVEVEPGEKEENLDLKTK